MANTLEHAYALLIGVGNDLPITVNDATAIYNILIDPELSGYKKENIKLLTEKEATRDGILSALDELISKAGKEASVFIYYSGHGGHYEPWKQFYLVPNNFDPDNYEETWVKAEELSEKIAAFDTDKLIFLLDCCHAAGMTKNKPKEAVDELSKANELAEKIDLKSGMSILSSCREDQLSWILDGDNNSLFTKCLIEVLKGKHTDNFDEDYIRISEVVQYIFKKVPERKPVQTPYANLQIYEDFILSFVPAGIRKDIPAPKKDDRMEMIIQMEIDDLMDTYKKKQEKLKYLSDQHDIQSDPAMKYTLEKQMLAIDEEKVVVMKKMEHLQTSLKSR